MFGFVYEDAEIEKSIIKKYLDDNNIDKINNGCMILSGGCTMFEIAHYFENLTALDTSIKQIDLVEQKIKIIENNDKINYNNFLQNIHMNFDEMFIKIHNGYKIDDIFSRHNLIKNFGLNAVENTSQNFAAHFQKVYNSRSIYHDFIFNRNMNSKIKNYNQYVENIDDIKKVYLLNKNMITFLEQSDKKYDFIQTSNITDWMNNNDFIYTCNLLKNKLNKNGILIMRRMLSDNILETQFENNIKLIDNTNIYSECILYKNI